MGRGKLVFKGDKAKKKKGSSKHKTDEGRHSSSAGAATCDAAAGGEKTNTSVSLQQSNVTLSPTPLGIQGRGDAAASSDHQTKDLGPKINDGQGLITSSSTVVSGHGTSFKSQLHVGDALLVRTQKGSEEMRVIKMVLSNVSISISSAFSSDLRTPTAFRYINKPRDHTKEKAALAQKARAEKEEVEQRAMGTYGNKGEIIYREKTEHGGYRIRKEKATTDMSRSDLLAVRAKKKSDRYC
ncbi:hypothetical protein ACHAWF_014742 [Thalassiosira exigua]